MMTLEGFPFIIVNTKEYHSECSGKYHNDIASLALRLEGAFCISTPGLSQTATYSNQQSRSGDVKDNVRISVQMRQFLLKKPIMAGRVVHCITGSMMTIFNTNNHLCDSDSICIDPLSCLLKEQLLEPALNLTVHCGGLEFRVLNGYDQKSFDEERGLN
ncbi:hypothetical protein Tco_0920226 [Tanacetum coccineum]